MASFAILLSFGSVASAQTFGPRQENPFGLKPVLGYGLNTVAFTDLDGDGDQDVIGLFTDYYESSDYYYFKNNGTKSNPDFGQMVSNPFGLAGANINFLVGAVDIDNDGDQDLFSIEYDYDYETTDLLYLENKGTKTNPSFSAPVKNPFNLSIKGYYSIAFNFVDIDNDGDYDAMQVDHYTGGFLFYQNTGNAANPTFAQPVNSPFDLPQEYSYAMDLVFGDIDSDGDFDLMTIDYGSTVSYFENTGSVSSPSFAAPVKSPSSLISLASNYVYLNSLALTDLDDDGDPDILFADYYYDYDNGTYFSNFHYFENTSLASIKGISDNSSELKLYPQPCFNEVSINIGSDVSGNYTISISDVTGKLLITEEVNDPGDHTVSTEDLSPGFYLIDVRGENFYASGKLIKRD